MKTNRERSKSLAKGHSCDPNDICGLDHDIEHSLDAAEKRGKTEGIKLGMERAAEMCISDVIAKVIRKAAKEL